MRSQKAYSYSYSYRRLIWCGGATTGNRSNLYSLRTLLILRFQRAASTCLRIDFFVPGSLHLTQYCEIKWRSSNNRGLIPSLNCFETIQRAAVLICTVCLAWGPYEGVHFPTIGRQNWCSVGCIVKRQQPKEIEWELWKELEPIVKAVPRCTTVSSLAEPSQSEPDWYSHQDPNMCECVCESGCAVRDGR